MADLSHYPDSGEKVKICNACRLNLPMSAFTPLSAKKDGRHGTCKPCRAASQAEKFRENPDLIRAYGRASRLSKPKRSSEPGVMRWVHLMKKYGLSREQYEAMHEAQSGRCKLCKTDTPKGRFNVFCVDHCHSTGRIRGLLCVSCNSALGKLGDTPEAIRNVLEYVLGSAPDGHVQPEQSVTACGVSA